jgi:endonuclease V-like protein UPF0215 family
MLRAALVHQLQVADQVLELEQLEHQIPEMVEVADLAAIQHQVQAV